MAYTDLWLVLQLWQWWISRICAPQGPHRSLDWYTGHGYAETIVEEVGAGAAWG
jgi:hypothetical protein